MFKDLDVNVYNSCIHNHQKLETIQTSTNKVTDKEPVVHPQNGIVLSHEREQTKITLSERSRQKMLHTV